MSKELGREPTVGEISEQLGIPVEEVVMAMEASCTPESLYSTLGEGDNSSTLLIDKIANESENQEVDIVDRIDLRKVLDTLKPREKQIIVLRYFKEKPRFKCENAGDIPGTGVKD